VEHRSSYIYVDTLLKNTGEDMTDDELKAWVASLAVDSKNLHEAQK
jgi:hypothetical protein